MSWWKQTGLTVILLAMAAFFWLRLDPGAATRLQAMGVPQSVLVHLAPAETAARSAGPGTPQARGGPGGAQGGRPGGPQGGGRDTLVVTRPVATESINDRVSAIGDGEALRSVTIVPLASGVITEMAVGPGDAVTEGMVLARLDSDGEQIARDRAALAVEVAQDKVTRNERLVSSRTVSEVQLIEARNELANARLALRDAELALERRSIVAPIGGKVGLVPVEVGAYVTNQTEIATIDDRSGIIVDYWVPERFAALIEIGQRLEAIAIALPERVFTGSVAAIGARVDRDSRTLQVRARLDNPGDVLRPGMSFRVTMRFPGQAYPAIDPLALQWSSEGPFVWKAVDGKAERTPVRIIQRNSDFVLVEGKLAAGEPVVTEGVQTLRPGAQLRIAGETPIQPPQAGG